MLAKLGKPFSSDDYHFEIKWDGTRVLCFADGDDLRLINRNQNVVKPRYPELDFLQKLPAGAILDGEVVVLKEGKPDFSGMLQREQARNPKKIEALARSLPAVYIVFDLLYRDFEPITEWTLVERREALHDMVTGVGESRLVFSDGILGEGEAFFEKVCEQEMEGIVAKKLESKYLPGRRSEAWIKIKRRQSAYCLILGFLPDGDDLKSLILATEEGGQLHYVGRVGSGWSEAKRKELNAKLRGRLRTESLLPTAGIPSAAAALWVEPELYCEVSYLERTSHGELRAPVFERLVRA
jgi:DNA ligase D-like protein (predicted ligase)